MEWIKVSEKLPELLEEKDYSENVLATDGTRLYVMSYWWINDGENAEYAWCNCYGDIDGEGEFDDDYNITHWMPLPQLPKNNTH